MSKYIIEINSDIITQKGTEAIIDFYHTMAIDELRLAGLNVFATGVDSPFLNVAIDTQQKHSSDVVLQVEKFLNNHHAPWAWFMPAPTNAPDLKSKGFSLLEEFPGMYFDLKNEFPAVSIGSSSIQEVDKKNDLFDWIQPICDAFPSDDQGEGYRKLNANLLKSGEKKLHHYVLSHQNQTVAAATLFLSNHSVMLHNLATKTAFRKQGFGTALTLHMMHEAKNMGYEHCFLDSSEEGFYLYQRLGFKVYCITSAYQKNN